MATEPRGPFRQKSLERLSSPERLDQLLHIVDRKSWVPLLALGVLVSGLVVWSVFGSIPVTVEGKGILVHPRTVTELEAQGAGRLVELKLQEGDRVEPGTVLGRIAQPELEKQLELQQAKVVELSALERAVAALQPAGIEATAGSATAGHIGASRAVAQRLRDQGIEALVDERALLETQREAAVALADALRRRWQDQVLLGESGIISTQEILDAEQEHLDALERVSSFETRLLQLRTREIEINDRYFSRLESIADLGFDLEGYGQQIADARREIERLEQRLEQEGRIVSEHGGRIVEISARVGQYVVPGDRLGVIAQRGGETLLSSLTYFRVSDGKRLSEGDRIRVTPDTVQRERYGGIEGRISRISELPVTLDEAENMIGNRELAETLVAGAYRIQVLADLDPDPQDPQRFKWSTSRGPEIALSAGTTTTARVAVEKRRPIGFVVPLLRRSTGTD